MSKDSPQPRWGCVHHRNVTQGSSCLATLGWKPRSLWDCSLAHSRILRRFVLRASESFTQFPSRNSHAKLARRFFAATPSHGPRIPTGFRPKAQGCEERATLGHRSSNLPNRNAVAANPFLPACMSLATTPVGIVSITGRAPRVGVARQPWAGGRNPLRIAHSAAVAKPSRGRPNARGAVDYPPTLAISSFVATLTILNCSA
jgi:hypothetical protein